MCNLLLLSLMRPVTLTGVGFKSDLRKHASRMQSPCRSCNDGSIAQDEMECTFINSL